MTTNKKIKVYIALSGGVDSSVAAALLQRAGFDVTGVFLRCWEDSAACSAPQDERMAHLVTSILKIPFLAWDFCRAYRERVLSYLVKSYARGLTPNPDIICNREIKFGLFWEKCRELGADFMATGHYARLARQTASKDHSLAPAASSLMSSRVSLGKLGTEQTRSGDPFQRLPRFSLLKARDRQKDQSYFLSYVKPNVLRHVLFPVGGYTKVQVRQMAREFGLPTAERKSSQGLCFVGQVDFDSFLKRYLKGHRGSVVDARGRVLGYHRGAFAYTLGQRQGLGLANGPYFVIRKDIRKNQLVVSRNKKDLERKEILVDKMNWFARPEKSPATVRCQIRYRQSAVASKIFRTKSDKRFRVVFAKPVLAPASGQFAVFYRDQELIGGGVIGN